MDFIPEIDEKVLYPKGVSFHPTTVWNMKIRQFQRALIDKIPNEFKYMMRNYNHRNNGIISWHIDGNVYNHF